MSTNKKTTVSKTATFLVFLFASISILLSYMAINTNAELVYAAF